MLYEVNKMNKNDAKKILEEFLINNQQIFAGFRGIFFPKEGNDIISCPKGGRECAGVYIKGQNIGVDGSFCGIDYQGETVFFTPWDKKKDYPQEWVENQNFSEDAFVFSYSGNERKDWNINSLKTQDWCSIGIKNCSDENSISEALKKLLPLFIDFCSFKLKKNF